MSNAPRKQGAQEKSLSGCELWFFLSEFPPTIFDCHA